MHRLILTLVVLLAIGCGTITMDIDTSVSETGQAVHDYEITVEGPLVKLVELSRDELAELPEGLPPDSCERSMDGDVLTIKCEGLVATELAEDDLGFYSPITVVETEQGTEYRMWMPHPFAVEDPFGLNDWDTGDPEFDDFAEEAFDPEEILDLSLIWNFRMPGEIIRERSNADSYSGSTARFEYVLGDDDDERETWELVSIVRPSSGWACSAPLN